MDTSIEIYGSCLSIDKCAYIENVINFERKNNSGRPTGWKFYQILNFIKSGRQWRMLPLDFPPWPTVFYHYNRWYKNGIWQKINDVLNQKDRIRSDRDPTPSASIVDSQSVKTTETGGPKEYDAEKKINGRKRQILVDVEGRIIGAVVHEADIQDRDGAKLLLRDMKEKYPRLKLIWVDDGYRGKLIEWVKELGLDLEIVKRSDDLKGFKVLSRRWVVERTFGWFNRFRRLSKVYEYLLINS